MFEPFGLRWDAETWVWYAILVYGELYLVGVWRRFKAQWDKIMHEEDPWNE